MNGAFVGFVGEFDVRVMGWRSNRCVIGVLGSRGLYEIHTTEKMASTTAMALASSTPAKPVNAMASGPVIWDHARSGWRVLSLRPN